MLFSILSFWIFLILFLASWFLYPTLLISLVVLFILKNKGQNSLPPSKAPGVGVTVILPVYNGEHHLKSKIGNLLSIDCHRHSIEIIVVSDGSTDRTLEILGQIKDPRVRSFNLHRNSGKSVAQNIGVQHAKNEILLFSDLESTIDPDALKWIIPHFQNPEVGCVGMNVIFRRPDWDSSGSQNLYGKLENMIRMAESRLGVLTSLFGSAFAVRKAYFKPLDADTGDDFIIPLDMALQGYKTVFEPNAIVYDDWSSNGLKSEIKVRQRITLRNFTGLLRRRSLLNPLKHFKLSFALFFHKVFRWLSPIFLAILFSTSFALRTEGVLYSAAFLAQLLAYFIAMVGIFSTVRGKPIIGASTLGTFVVANFGILMGLFSLLKGQRILGYRN